MKDLFKNLYPDEWIESTYSIDFKRYYDLGYRGVIFDIDNTLVPHGEDADERAIRLFDELKSIGFNVCLLSNNNQERVERFNKFVNAQYIYKAQKPYHKNYYKAAMKMRLSVSSVLFIGDQIFTDIYGANVSNIHSILVNPINPKEEFQIVLKRYLEKPILLCYKLYCRRNRKANPVKRTFSKNS